MSTFVVRFVGDLTRGYRGRVQHVPSGEEASFANLEALLAFFDQVSAAPSHEVGETKEPAIGFSRAKPEPGAKANRGAKRRESA